VDLIKELLIEQSVNNIGNKIKLLRTQQKFSLQQLAGRTGVSSTAIHKIERGEMTPTITVLMKIASVFGKTVGYFVGEEQEFNHFEFVEGAEFYQSEERKRISNSKRTIEIEPVAIRLCDGKIYAAVMRFMPGEHSSRGTHSHHGEELIYQIEGSIEYTVSGKAYVLKPRDSLHFLATQPHSWRVIGKKRCVHLWIMTPPPSGATELQWRDIHAE